MLPKMKGDVENKREYLLLDLPFKFTINFTN